jgi:hypothetical protein
MKLTFGTWVLLVCATLSAIGQTQFILKFEKGVVHVVGVAPRSAAVDTTISDDQWNAILSVYTHEAYLKKIDQPVAGTYSWNDDTLVFKPAYAFASGETYHAVFEPKKLLISAGIQAESSSDKLELSYSIPMETFPTTTIESIYPASANLPENLLRVYIYFSAPMMPGEAYHHISLMRENETTVEKAFLLVDQELWDIERKRFTLFFDPGRIKRDLKSNIELGTPLQEGGNYLLVIDSAWRDAYGNAIEKSIKKKLSIKRAERTKVSPSLWKVIPPEAGTLAHVVILFDRPMDHALALKHITIKNVSGLVTGQAQTVDDTAWKFTPDHPWVEGKHIIMISPLLEDVAGNNLNNAFDLELLKESRVNSVEPVELPFMIKSLTR